MLVFHNNELSLVIRSIMSATILRHGIFISIAYGDIIANITVLPFTIVTWNYPIKSVGFMNIDYLFIVKW